MIFIHVSYNTAIRAHLEHMWATHHISIMFQSNRADSDIYIKVLITRHWSGRPASLVCTTRAREPKCFVLFVGKKNKLRVYYLSWLRNKILHNDPEVEKKQGWTTVGELEGCVHYKVGTSSYHITS